MALPERGREHDDVIAALGAMREGDARWQDGRTFGLVYDAGAEVQRVAEAAALMYLHENALNPGAFPSLGRIQRGVCSAMADLLSEPDAAGFMTSGGTESIMMAVKAARERGRRRGVDRGHIVVAESAHVAHHKAAYDLGLDVTTVTVAPDWRADVDAMASAVHDRTVLVVGSAPQYPQGVIDPIPELAAIAAAAGATMHVDACMGGFVLPFMERLGEPVPPWDFRVRGVTSISLDVHKLGYAPKGASIILHRTKELRQDQVFEFDGWLGGYYASPNMQGTRSGAPMAAAWAVMQRLGIDGYCQLTAVTLEAARRIRAGIDAIDGIEIVGIPDAHLHAITACPGSDLDIFAVGDAMSARGWVHDRQSRPDSLHATVSAGNAPVVDEYLADLATCVGASRGATVEDRSTNYARSDRAG